MGTLFDQQPRDNRNIEINEVKERLKEFMDIANLYKISLSDVINTAKILEMERASNLFVRNGDIHDEQMGGLGEILVDIKDSMNFIGTVLDG